MLLQRYATEFSVWTRPLAIGLWWTSVILLLAAVLHIADVCVLYLIITVAKGAHFRMWDISSILLLILCAYFVYPPMLRRGLRQREISLLYHPEVAKPISRHLIRVGSVRLRIPQLPVELWERILEHAIDAPLLFAPDCDSTNILEFIHNHEYHSPNVRSPNGPVPSNIHYQRSERRRWELSCVCNSWKELMDRRSRRWIHSGKEGLPYESVGTERVEIALRRGQCIIEGRGEERPTVPALNYPRLSTLAITITGEDIDFDTVCDRIQVFAQIKCHAYQLASPQISITEAVPSLLSATFPHLTSLILTSKSIGGCATLPSLKILCLLADKVELSSWHCPSLKHLLIMPINIMPRLDHPNYSSQILPCSPAQLESLVVGSLCVATTAEFWRHHSSLQLLGFAQFKISSEPPPCHPINRLYSPNPFIYCLYPDGLIDALNLIPQLRSIRLLEREDRPPGDPPELLRQWDRFYILCHQRGVDFQSDDTMLLFANKYVWPDLGAPSSHSWKGLLEWRTEAVWGFTSGLLFTTSTVTCLFRNEGLNWKTYWEHLRFAATFVCVAHQGFLLYRLIGKVARGNG